jgi:uncharacterized protein HemX
MTERSLTRAPPRRSYAGVLLLLLVLGAAAFGWQAWRSMTGQRAVALERVDRLSGEVQALRAQLQTLNERDSELLLTVKRHDDAIAGLSGHVDDALHAGRSRIQLAAVEELLLLANDRLLLAHDPVSAERALAEADRRLAAISDPGLLQVRQALSKERAALGAVPKPDTTGAALSLAELVRQAPKYPLMGRVPQNFETPAPKPADTPGEGPGDRTWHAAKTALASIFAVHKSEGLSPRLLAPEEEALVRQVLELKLEGARLSLIAGDSAAFHDLVVAAQRWLGQYFNLQDPAVEAARRELERLARVELSPALPDISRSLALLRGRLENRPQ